MVSCAVARCPRGLAVELDIRSVKGKLLLSLGHLVAGSNHGGVMGCISTRVVDGKLWFVATYLDDNTTYRSTDPGPRLAKAVAAIPGATMGQSRDLRIEVHWGDEADRKYECLSDVTSANVAALLKSEFRWEDDALAAARAYVSPPEALECIRALQELNNRLVKLALPGSAATEAQPVRKWRFWRR